MKAPALTCLGLAALGLLAGGCLASPPASRPLTTDEMAWASVIRTSYRGWRVPRYPIAGPGDAHGDLALPSPLVYPSLARPGEPTAELEYVPAEKSR